MKYVEVIIYTLLMYNYETYINALVRRQRYVLEYAIDSIRAGRYFGIIIHNTVIFLKDDTVS